MNRRNLLCALGIGAAAAGLGRGAIAAPAPRPGPRAKRFPNFVLTTHEGNPVRFYDDLLRGKTVVINFMYTNCGGFCPGQTANLVRLQRQLGERIGREIFMYSITLEPELDTPENLRDYAEGFGVGPGWLFLTGRKHEIERIRRALGFVDPDPALDRERTSHIGVVLYGSEPLDRWAAHPALGHHEVLAHSILSLQGGSPWAPPFRRSEPLKGGGGAGSEGRTESPAARSGVARGSAAG